MSVLEEAKTEIVKSDVLVIGGGIAACNTACKAKESGLSVVLVDKGGLGRSGLSPCMSGILTCFDPDKDDESAVYRERVELSAWMADQDCLEGMNEATIERVREMETWGAQFQKDAKGEYIRKAGVGATNARNVSMVHGGLQLMAALRGEVIRRGIKVVERVMVTDLLTSDSQYPTTGTVVGAVGFNLRTGKFYVFKSKATIIATGGSLAGLIRCVHPHCSGDGRGMAFRAGAEFRNMDLAMFAQRLRDFKAPIGPGAHIFAMELPRIVNNQGEEFINAHSDRASTCRAFYLEETQGRGPVYVDARNLAEDAHYRIEKAIPLVVDSITGIGQNFRKDKIPYTVGLLGIGGGIKVNRECAATIPGLYAAGDASDLGYQGANENLSPGMGSAIYGWRAGKAAAKYSAEIEHRDVGERQVKELKDRIYAPLRVVAGLDHYTVRAHGRGILERGLIAPIKNEKNLNEALRIVQDIRDNEVPGLKANDFHDLARVLGVENELLFLELIARASLVRKESRGFHFREDYPNTDNVNWLKWVVMKKNRGVDVWTEPIPFEQYRLKPSSWKKP